MKSLSRMMDFKILSEELVEVIKKYRHILIAIKGSPDPDVVAASFVFKLICEAYDTQASIDSPVHPSLPQNRKIIKDLNLPICFDEFKDIKAQYDAYAVFDHQSVDIDGITGVIPCAVHIDHHDRVDEEIQVDFKLIVDDAGSTSTVLAFLMEELKSELKPGKALQMKIATALEYGLCTDTNNLQYATSMDRQALEIISPFSDKVLLRKIGSLHFSKQAMGFLNQALSHHIVYKDWLICGIGFMDEKYRDSIAIIGDFLLKREDITTVVVFSIIEKKAGLTLDASFRTRKENFNLNALIKRITREGGGRKFKGAFQVNLDYFANCPDKERLWDVVYLTTIEALKKQRDQYRVGFLKDLWRKIFD